MKITLYTPFSSWYSKNKMWAHNSFRTYIPKEAQQIRDDLTIELKNELGDKVFKKEKVWISLFIEKPDNRCDAVNFIDTICDVVKKVIGIDDRYFSIREVDWKIVKDKPKIFIKIEQPVPKVALAVPAAKQPSPNAAACESPIMLLIGSGLLSNPPKFVSPKYEADGLKFGRLSFDRPNCANRSVSHCSVCRLKNNVRDALV